MIAVVALRHVKCRSQMRERAHDPGVAHVGARLSYGDFPLLTAGDGARLAAYALIEVDYHGVARHQALSFCMRTKFTRIPVLPMMGSTCTCVISLVSEAPR